MIGTAIRIAMRAAFGRDAAAVGEKILGRPTRAVFRDPLGTGAAPPTDPVEPTRQMRRREERRLAKTLLRRKK